MKMTELKMNIKCVSDQYVRGRKGGMMDLRMHHLGEGLALLWDWNICGSLLWLEDDVEGILSQFLGQ
ncbi:hypothetical protein TNCT_52961, partial [Trichonephila clavata]